MLKRRAALTAVEVLVILIVLFLLAGLCIPRTSCHINTGRRWICLNNARQLAVAQAILMSNRRNAFGGYLESLSVGDGVRSPDDDSSSMARELVVAWPTKLLPVIEQAPLHERIINGDETLDINALPNIEVFNCPSDPSLDLEAAGIAFVTNSGMPDLAEASENQPSDLRVNGISHDQRPGRFGPEVSFKNVKDGYTSTILFSENTHRDPPGSADEPGNTWLRPAPGAANPEQWYGMVWVVDPQNPRAPRAELMERFNRDSRSESERDQPYSASGTRFARPASNHISGFNVIFCGGNASCVRDDIDYAVYQQLMTPNGAKAAPADAPDQPFEETLPDAQRFMNPPITDADF